MNRALLYTAILASGFVAALAAQAAPVNGVLPVNGFGAMNARDSGATLDPLGDLGVDASAIARAWPGDGHDGTGATTPAPGGEGFTPPADFEALLRDGNGHALGAASGLDRNPYFAGARQSARRHGRFRPGGEARSAPRRAAPRAADPIGSTASRALAPSTA